MQTESELLQQFEDLSLPVESFRHETHLRLAWYVCSLHGLADAVDRFTNGLKGFATNAGAPNLFHETITLFYLYQIFERRRNLPPRHNWDDFKESNPDLFVSRRDFIHQYYPENLLQSQAAKSHVIPHELAGYEPDVGMSTVCM